MTMKNKQENTEQINADAEINAIYKITDDPNTPPEVKNYLLDHLFQKTGISVDVSEAEPEKAEKEPVTITIYTDWNCEAGDRQKADELRIEKSSQMASALFHLIEISCMPYEPLTLGEANSEFVQKHLESIRSVAELGKQLAYQI